MQTKAPRHSLTNRFLLVLIALSVLVSAVIIAGYHGVRTKRMENELALQLGVVAAQTGPLILQAHQVGEMQTRLALMKSLFGFPAVECVMLSDQNGTLLTSWPPGTCTPQNADIKLPLSDGKTALHITTHRAYANEEVRRSTALFAGFVIALLAAVAGLVYVLIGKFVMHPISRLRDAMEQSEPHSPVLAREIQDDEIGQLARAYNRLAAAARRFFAQLRETEAQVRKSETRFKDMAEISGDWFYEMDAGLRFSYISDRFFEITGLQKNDVLGKTRQMVAEQFSTQPHILEHLSTLEAKSDFRDFEYTIKTGDGEACYISVSGKPIYSEVGEFLGYRGTGRDVTILREKEHLLAEANRNFGDSVSYASRFQHRLLTRPENLSPHWGEVELIWQPRDMVGGDFLKSFSIKGSEYLVCFDCTGHGVPGAFMVMIVSAVIDRIVYRFASPPDPAMLLKKLHQGVCEALQLAPDETSRDGLDCAVLCMDEAKKSISYAGASIDLFILSDNGDVERVQAPNTKLGYVNQPFSIRPETQQFEVGENCFVVMTDGLATQIGGQGASPQKRMMGTGHILKLLSGEMPDNQRNENTPRAITRQLMRGLRNWQGQQERRDDVMILAFKPK